MQLKPVQPMHVQDISKGMENIFTMRMITIHLGKLDVSGVFNIKLFKILPESNCFKFCIV